MKQSGVVGEKIQTFLAWNTKFLVFFHQNSAKTQYQNFRGKFTFLEFSQNFIFKEVAPLPWSGHIWHFYINFTHFQGWLTPAVTTVGKSVENFWTNEAIIRWDFSLKNCSWKMDEKMGIIWKNYSWKYYCTKF